MKVANSFGDNEQNSPTYYILRVSQTYKNEINFYQKLVYS